MKAEDLFSDGFALQGRQLTAQGNALGIEWLFKI